MPPRIVPEPTPNIPISPIGISSPQEFLKIKQSKKIKPLTKNESKKPAIAPQIPPNIPFKNNLINLSSIHNFLICFGGRGRNRTSDLVIISDAL